MRYSASAEVRDPPTGGASQPVSAPDAQPAGYPPRHVLQLAQTLLRWWGDALDFTGLDEVKVKHTPRLLSDNGPCYLSSDLADYLAANGMTHSRGRPYHPQTQGKIERWHRSMKNQSLLNNYYLPSELQEHIQRFVTYYNHARYHESLANLTPAAVYYGSGHLIREERELIKLNTLALRRQLHYDRQLTANQMS